MFASRLVNGENSLVRLRFLENLYQNYKLSSLFTAFLFADSRRYGEHIMRYVQLYICVLYIFLIDDVLCLLLSIYYVDKHTGFLRYEVLNLAVSYHGTALKVVFLRIKKCSK